MNQRNRSRQSPLFRTMLGAIRRELRRWYGLISVEELVANKELVLEIEVLERMLARQGS